MSMGFRKSLATIGLIAAVLVGAGCSSSEPVTHEVPAPPVSGNIVDDADLLSAHEEAEINRLIEGSNAETDAARVAVYTYDENRGRVKDYAQAIGNSWGVGDAGRDNGVLIAVDMDSREVAIATADGVRENLTDSRAQAIIDDTLAPQLRDQQYAAGITDAVRDVYSAAQTEPPAENNTGNYIAAGVLGFAGLALLAIFAVYLRMRRQNREAAFTQADQEIERALAEDPTLKVDEQTREAYRKYRSAYPQEPVGGAADYNKKVEEDEALGDHRNQYTRYTDHFAIWLPLYAASPSLYSGIGVQPPSYTAVQGSSAAGGSSFGGGSGFNGGGASGSF